MAMTHSRPLRAGPREDDRPFDIRDADFKLSRYQTIKKPAEYAGFFMHNFTRSVILLIAERAANPHCGRGQDNNKENRQEEQNHRDGQLGRQ